MTTSRILVSGLSLLVVGLAACGGFGEDVSVGSDAIKGSDGGGGETDGGGASADGGKPCQDASECGVGLWACAFSPTSVCGDYGKCVFYGDEPICASISPGCSCGHTVNMGCNGIPTGYVVGPATTSGACPGDGGIIPGTICGKDSDCNPATEMCGFATADACTAAGHCYVKEGGALCNSELLGCACDGTTFNTVCNGYPDGVEPKPLSHTGSCDGG